MRREAAMTGDKTSVFADDWSGEMGQRWLRNVDHFEAMLEPIGTALLDRAAIATGERIVDLGCGGARAGADFPALRFFCGDAASAVLPAAPYDRLVSRFGSMFFADPVAAFRHLRTQLVPGARFDLAVWGPPRDNVWMMAVMGVIRAHVEVPPATPRAPGPFAFEDIDYLRDLLADAGFARVDIDDWRGDQAIGGPGRTPAEAADFALGSMSAARVLSEAGADVMAAARADLERVYAEHHDPEAGVRLGARAWLVTAA
jgi:SAM-dependent methyltransferase